MYTLMQLLSWIFFLQEERGRRQVVGGAGGVRGSGIHGAETLGSNLASITPSAREATAVRAVAPLNSTVKQHQQQRSTSHRTTTTTTSSSSNSGCCESRSVNASAGKSGAEAVAIEDEQQSDQQQQVVEVVKCSVESKGARSAPGLAHHVVAGNVAEVNHDKFKGTVESLLKASEATQGKLNDRSMLKIEKPAKGGLHEPGAIKAADKMNKSASQEQKSKVLEASVYSKAESIKYYGELMGYDYKSYGNIDNPPASVHESKASSSSGMAHDKSIHAKVHSHQVYSAPTKSSDSKCSYGGDKYSESYYHRAGVHGKPPTPISYQMYQETKYSYNVNGVPGTPAQSSAAAAFFAR